MEATRAAASAAGPSPGSTAQSRVRSPAIPRTRASGVSRASRVPWSMMATRSLSVAASSMSWVVMTTVIPDAFSSATFSHRKRRAAGSSPVDGSSRKSTDGPCMSARAIIIRWIWPPEKSSGRPSDRSASPNWSRRESARRTRSSAGTPW